MIRSTFLKTASVEELREQLAATKKAREDAERTVTAAEHAFDEAGDQPTSKALGKARDALRDAEEHVARAERLLAAGEEREAAKKREELEALFDELDAKTTDDAAREAGRRLAEEETALVIKLAECRLQRKRIRDELRSAEVRRDAIGKSLGFETAPAQTWGQMPDGRYVSFPTPADGAASPDLVRKGLKERIASCSPNDPLLPFLFAAEPKRADYAPANTYFLNE